jgi:RNA polymerase sigma factor (sigma-70 family)
VAARATGRDAHGEAACSAQGRIVAGSAAWCARIGRGDQAAFTLFYEAWFDRCYAMARGLTRRDESFCLDVVQEAMLRVARRVPPMGGDAQVARWMVRVVHSAGLDLLRREARARRRERAGARPEASDGHDAAAESLAAAWLREAMAGLGDEERALVALRFGRGATLEAAGAAVGASGDAVHGKLRRALKRLRGGGP